MKKLLFLALAASTLMACNKTTEPKPEPTKEAGAVSIDIKNMVGTKVLELGSSVYQNAHGDDFSMSVYKYYISNIKLIGENGISYVEPESYHLINADLPASQKFQLTNVPAGKYTSIQIMLGVDSTRNVSGAQTGALDPGNGMFWTWSTGYINAKIEGSSPQSGDPFGKSIVFHLGGFTGKYNTIKTVTLPLTVPMVVEKDATPVLKLQSDVLAWFKSPNMIDFATDYSVMTPSENLKKVADNYFSHLSVAQ